MKEKLLTMLVVTGLGIVLGMSPGSAQLDLAKVLVGKWEGAVQWAAGAGSGVGDPNRTLIIDSVEQKDGKWVAMGKFGVTGKGLGKVTIEVEDSGSRPSIRFVTGSNSTVRLALSGTKDLTGTLTLPGTSQRGNDRRMNLEKKE
jgi:hypothetical protein